MTIFSVLGGAARTLLEMSSGSQILSSCLQQDLRLMCMVAKHQIPVLEKSYGKDEWNVIHQHRKRSRLHRNVNHIKANSSTILSQSVEWDRNSSWVYPTPTLPLYTSASLLHQKHSERDVPNRTSVETMTIPEALVNSAPSAWQPFLRLSRMHRPTGTWLLFWPCTWGLTLGAEGIPDLTLLTLFGLGAFIMRGAGCTINDMWDRHIDAKVKRTIDRPLACGQLRMRHAAVWLGAQISLAFTILLQLNAPCFLIGVGSLGLVVLYPLAKRVTDWPQGVLGLTFNTGVLMGYTAAQTGRLGYLAAPWIDPSCLCVYLAGLSWTLIYDTIYAHQDRNDDATLGLGSTALKFGEDTKLWLSGFGVSMVSLLTTAGCLGELGWPYFVGVAATGSHIIWQIKTLDIHNHENCADRFTANRHLGWIIFLSLVGSYWIQDYNKTKSSGLEVPSLDIDISSGTSGIGDAIGASDVREGTIQSLVPKYNKIVSSS